MFHMFGKAWSEILGPLYKHLQGPLLELTQVLVNLWNSPLACDKSASCLPCEGWGNLRIKNGGTKQKGPKDAQVYPINQKDKKWTHKLFRSRREVGSSTEGLRVCPATTRMCVQ